MADPYARWDELEREKRAFTPALHDPTIMMPSCGGLRVRREYVARDAINSRAWDFFHATPPTTVASESLGHTSSTAPIFMDMKPICSRTNTVQYRLQPEYMPPPPTTKTTESNVGSTGTGGFYANPYTQRLDSGGEDARNMMRELRGAVVEDNRERQIDATRQLAERQFQGRWLPPVAATDAASLQAYELLRPKMDWNSSSS